MSKKMATENAALLYRNLASAARHELSFIDLFAVLREDPDLCSKKAPVAAIMHEALKEGNSLPDAMARIPRQFSVDTVELVRQAEKNGQLPAILDLLADDQAWTAQTSKAIKGAIAWPLTMLAFAILLLSLVMIFVIPAFAELFNSFGASLPLPTRMVIGLSDLMVTYWWLWLALGMGVWVAVKRDLLPRWLLSLVERIVLSVPFVRNYMVRGFSFRLLNWLASCVQKPDMQPLVLAHLIATTGSHTLRKVLNEFSSRLKSGQTLGHALDQLSPLPRRMALQVQIGEKTSNPEGAIAQAIDVLETELANLQSRFGQTIYLTGYLLVGCAIGFTVIALYLPIFMMGSAV